MANVWLEMRSCNDANTQELDIETVLRLPALSEAIRVAESTGSNMRRKDGQQWEYSVKLEEKEVLEVSSLFSKGTERDDGRATLRTIDVKYNGSCYTLTLFVFKQ